MQRLLAALVLLLIASTAEAKSRLEVLVDQLAGSDSQKWSAAYTELQRLKDPKVIPLLLAAAPELELTPQSYAVYIINALPDSKATRSALRALTKMKPPYLRAHAAKALFNRGDRDMEQVAIQVAKDVRGDESVAQSVLGAFIYFRSEALAAELRRWIEEDPPERIFSKLVYFFHVLQERGDVLALFEARLAHASPTVRGLSAAYLFAYGAGGRADELGQILAEAIRTGQIEYSEFVYVDYMLINAGSMSDDILEALAARLPEEDGYYGARLLRMLGRGGYSGIVPLARRLLDDDDKEISKAAFEVLAAVPGGFTQEALAGLLTGADDARRLMAAESLRRADDLSGVGAVIEVLGGSKDALARRDAARILGDFRMQQAVEPLLQALADDDSLVRSYATSSLQRVWQTLFPYRRIDLRAAGWVHTAPAPERKTGLERLRAWWKANKDARW